MKAKLNLDAVLVPGLFSPPGTMLPLKAYLKSRVAHTTIWNHAPAKKDLTNDLYGLADFLSVRSADRRPIAIIALGSGDWIVRQVLAGLSGEQPSHYVSVSPVWRSERAATFLHQSLGSNDARIKLLSDSEQLARHEDPPAHVRHLVLQAPFDSQSPSSHSIGSPSLARCRHGLHCRVRGVRVSLIWQPNVWHRIDQFLRSQSVGSQQDREHAFRMRRSPDSALNPAPMAKVG